MKQQKYIRKTLEQYDSEWPPEDAAGLMAWFQERINEVPLEHQETLRIELGSDNNCTTIEIIYARMETDEEEAAREQYVAEEAERRRVKELRTLAELQAKYGKPST